jgi:hypothetical protein
MQDFDKPESQRQYEEAHMHEERVREVRKILVDLGRDEIEEMLSTPFGLKTFVDMITTERHLAGEPTPWTFDPLRADAADQGSLVGGLSLDADFAAAVESAAEKQKQEQLQSDLEDDEFADDEIIYHDKDMVDPADLNFK